MANVEAYNTGLTEEEIDEAFSNALNTYTKTEEDALLGDKANAADLAAVATSGDYDDLTNKPVTDAAPTENSTNAVQSGGVFAALAEKADTAAVFGTGTLIPNDGDLFTLPVGKYYRNTNPTVIANIPSDLTVAFYCEIVNTIADNRRKIYLYPATVQTAGVFYTCLETGSGYGAWYKFTGEAVV